MVKIPIMIENRNPIIPALRDINKEKSKYKLTDNPNAKPIKPERKYKMSSFTDQLTFNIIEKSYCPINLGAPGIDRNMSQL